MKLYSAETSPYARKVRILLHETGQFGDVEIVPAYGTPLDPQTMPLAQNPLGKLPALERADGPAIYDSRVICRYLDARAGGKLYPEGNRLWETLTLEATADGITRCRDPDGLRSPRAARGQAHAGMGGWPMGQDRAGRRGDRVGGG